MVESTDEQLVADLKSNPQAFRALYDRHAGVLLRFIFRFTGNQQTAEEVLHDVFLELLNGNFDRFPPGGLKPWLFTTAKNKSLNLQRRLRHEMREMDASEAVDSLDLEQKMHLTFVHRKLAVAEKEMPPDLLETWQLRRQGFDYQKIANHLAIPLGTVKSRFHRLVAYFREELEK